MVVVVVVGTLRGGSQHGSEHVTCRFVHIFYALEIKRDSLTHETV